MSSVHILLRSVLSSLRWSLYFFFFFFFNDTATTEIYTLSLHDALPILCPRCRFVARRPSITMHRVVLGRSRSRDRKSTRLNSSHGYISYAVFCLKKKKNHLQREREIQSIQMRPSALDCCRS